MIKCPACKKEKIKSDFYTARNRWGGITYNCKECERSVKALQRVKYNDTYRKKDKRYYEKNKKLIIEKRKKWYQENKLKSSAHNKVKYALFKGILVRPRFCENYNISDYCSDIIISHHEDYNKPLEVKWLCQKCHMKLHHGK